MRERGKPNLRRGGVGAGATAIVALAGAGAIALGGCDAETRNRVGQSGSILAVISPPTPAEAARWAVDPYDANKRITGLNLLANAPFGGDPVYLKVYRASLGAPPASAPDADEGVQAVAARALSLHGAPSDVALVLPLLNSRDRRIRAEGVRALQRLHDPSAVTPLVAALSKESEEDVDVRGAAATALGQYAEPRVVQELIGALSDDSLIVNTAARQSLGTLLGTDQGEDGAAWLAWVDAHKDLFAARKQYVYPYFERDKYWYEFIPLVPPPPNELPGTPAGMAPISAVSESGATPR
ncbi:hypothetical protein BH11PLA1_BH11PLA1_23110 [soil metagenome]